MSLTRAPYELKILKEGQHQVLLAIHGIWDVSLKKL